MADQTSSIDRFEAALDALIKALDQLAADRELVAKRAEKLRGQLRSHGSLMELVGVEDQPLIVHLLRGASANLVDAFSQFQRAEAAILHSEGMSMERIGALFGVSRQRVADLLRRRDDATRA
ncbi:MAG TPA: helix-turn-helix domain-containing protein [Acidimicrobiales bacterium]|nr:helix-turn-helix domain-containing protein [Acidimicrobiales bacterium]